MHQHQVEIRLRPSALFPRRAPAWRVSCRISRTEHAMKGCGSPCSAPRREAAAARNALARRPKRKALDDDDVGLAIRQRSDQRSPRARLEGVVDRVAVDRRARKTLLARRERRQGTSLSPGPGNPGTGMPPVTTVTSKPSSSSAAAMRLARARCPMPSKVLDIEEDARRVAHRQRPPFGFEQVEQLADAGMVVEMRAHAALRRFAQPLAQSRDRGWPAPAPRRAPCGSSAARPAARRHRR